jgi:hypothetical protein
MRAYVFDYAAIKVSTIQALLPGGVYCAIEILPLIGFYPHKTHVVPGGAYSFEHLRVRLVDYYSLLFVHRWRRGCNTLYSVRLDDGSRTSSSAVKVIIAAFLFSVRRILKKPLAQPLVRPISFFSKDGIAQQWRHIELEALTNFALIWNRHIVLESERL